MRIKLDENLPARLALSLNDLGHDAQTVWEEGLAGREDTGIWEAAQVRLRSPSRKNLIQCVEGLLRMEHAGALAGCFVVATEQG